MMTPSPHLARLARPMLASLAVGVLLGTQLSGCETWPPPELGSAHAQGDCNNPLSSADKTRLSAIEQLLSDGKFYAALAQLDALGTRSPQTQLVRADALRRIGRDSEALAIYKSLEGTCLNGRAEHGLGLVAARAGQQAESLRYLTQARQALPTDTRVRNDLGYALLLAGQLEAAKFEFLTVLDLNPQDIKASRNLVLLTFKQGQPAKATELAARLGLDASTTDRLQQQAMRLNSAGWPESSPSSTPMDTK